jgi:hypothetical protein
MNSIAEHNGPAEREPRLQSSITPRILQWRAGNRAARLRRSGCPERRILPDPNRVGEELPWAWGESVSKSASETLFAVLVDRATMVCQPQTLYGLHVIRAQFREKPRLATKKLTFAFFGTGAVESESKQFRINQTEMPARDI